MFQWLSGKLSLLTGRIDFIVYLIVLLAALAIAITIFYKAFLAYNYSPELAAPPPSPSRQAPINSQLILDKHLFGQAKVKDISELKLPETRLAMSLRGTFTASHYSNASAIIEANEQAAKHYRVAAVYEGL